MVVSLNRMLSFLWRSLTQITLTCHIQTLCKTRMHYTSCNHLEQQAGTSLQRKMAWVMVVLLAFPVQGNFRETVAMVTEVTAFYEAINSRCLSFTGMPTPFLKFNWRNLILQRTVVTKTEMRDWKKLPTSYENMSSLSAPITSTSSMVLKLRKCEGRWTSW